MKYLLFFVFFLLLLGCSNKEGVYWCGDHACINKKEKEAYFKKTMIVEVRKLSKPDKDISKLEIIKKKTDLEYENNIGDKKKLTNEKLLEKKDDIKTEKELAKQARLDEKRRIKEEKELAKQARLDEKRRIKEEKELAKQILKEEKKIIKKDKKNLSEKKIQKEEKVALNTGFATLNISTTKFRELVEKVYKKNMFRSYPNIDDIPN